MRKKYSHDNTEYIVNPDHFDIPELARAISTNGWDCDNYGKFPEGRDFIVDIEGMIKFIDSWYYSPTEQGWVIPDIWFLKNYKKDVNH